MQQNSLTMHIKRFNINLIATLKKQKVAFDFGSSLGKMTAGIGEETRSFGSLFDTQKEPRRQTTRNREATIEALYLVFLLRRNGSSRKVKCARTPRNVNGQKAFRFNDERRRENQRRLDSIFFFQSDRPSRIDQKTAVNNLHSFTQSRNRCIRKYNRHHQ